MPGRDQSFCHCVRGTVGMAARNSDPVSNSLPAAGLKSQNTLMPRLATYSELAAQIHETHSPCLPSPYKADLLTFQTRLFPGQHIPRDGFRSIFSQCVTHVPGFSCYQCTRFVPLSVLSRQGRGGLLNLPGDKAAVNHQLCPRYEGRLVRGQEQHAVGHLYGLAGPPQRRQPDFLCPVRAI